jgi:hypothetical protein
MAWARRKAGETEKCVHDFGGNLLGNVHLEDQKVFEKITSWKEGGNG